MANPIPVDPETAHVQTLLATLRDNPANNERASDTVLAHVYAYLMAVPARHSDRGFHWFCSQAAPTTIAAATFLIRLFAYNSPQVDAWKARFQTCLAGCSDCVQGLEEAKLSSRDTFFGAYSDDILQSFYTNFEDWELTFVLEDLSSSGFLSPSDPTPQRTLSSAPPAVVYHMVSNLTVLKDPRILSIIRSFPPSEPFSSWPTDPPPPGLLILTMHENPDVRSWAKNQASKCHVVPIPPDKFMGSYRIAMEAIAAALTTPGHDDEHSFEALPASNNYLAGADRNPTSPFSFASNPIDLWAGFLTVLHLIPHQSLTSNTRQHFDFRRIVTIHLHDRGPQFGDILRCLLLLLKRTGSNFWAGQGPECPQLVFDAVKDNPSFSALLRDTDPAGKGSWPLGLFQEYLHTVNDPIAFGEVLAKVADFMCEELQHERFQDARPAIMVAGTRLLNAALHKYEGETMSRQRVAVSDVLNIHAETLIAVAFARPYNDSKWADARSIARKLITSVLVKDVQDVSAAIKQLARFLARYDVVVPIPAIKKQFWKNAYETLQTNDGDGVAAVISIVARSAHLDSLNKKSFSPAFESSNSRKGSATAEAAFDQVNRSLVVIRDGFLDAVSKYANSNVSSSVLDVLRRPGVVKDIMALMLSPVESIQVAAQTLVGLAFDVDVRLDCFRALLENLPDAALEGIFDFLGTFIQYAPIVPEACSLSKSLVRCFTDIIEVLCASHDGLLHNSLFLRSSDERGPASELPKLWNLMTQSITVIFKRTPLWSVYFENEDMIVWMRDALIFARDMLAQRRVIETAAATKGEQPPSRQHGSPGKLSVVGKKMVNDLQSVLPELARWLRLTDEELLHQSFSLLQSLLDCFRESHVTPSPAGVMKLNKHIDDARKNDPNRPQTRLDSARLSKLEDALASFESDDDDVQIISSSLGPQNRNKDSQKPKPTMAPDQSMPRKPLKVDSLKAPALKVPSRPSSSKPVGSRFFTGQDQQKLDAVASLPTFRKANQLPVANSKVSAILPPGRRGDAGPRNEGTSTRTQSEDSASSESESEEDEESQGGGLAALGKFQRSPKIKKPAERRQVKILDAPTHKRNPMQERLNRRDDARRTALRLKPDISGLHRTILSWNYDHQGPEPPITGNKPQLIHVPDKFADHSQYRAVFEPLLLLECWSQISQSKQETPDIYECKIASRQFSDDWLDLDISMTDSVRKDWYLAETDVILLRHLNGQKCILAKVQSYRSMPYGVQGNLRCFLPGGNMDPGLQINTSWRLSKVFSLSTLHREYAALVALPYYDLCGTILQPQLSKIDKTDLKEVRQTMTAYNLNEPQAIAISSALQTEGFALIQGPPGTGKTSTICGLVAAFLSKRPRPTVAVNVGRHAGPVDKSSSPKILLCAPSNAAIDEVAHRIKEGFRGPNKPSGGSKVVRVGADKAVNISVKDISLDSLVEHKLNAHQGPSKDASSEITALRGEIESVKRLKLQKLQELSSIHDNAARSLALEDEIKKLNSRRMVLTQQFDRLRDQQKSDSRTLDAVRRRFRVEVLQEADVICSTLSGAGHEILEQFDFEMVIIDEAAQAIELSSLIPLKYRCRSCIMVGDPQQLPPTVLSQEACKFQYNQSLFVRLQKHRPDAVHLLSIQYRMHPDISRLPSRVFYQGRLLDGPGLDVKTKQPWHSHAKFGTYRFFNVSRGIEEQSIHSLKNQAECQVAVALYSRLRQEFSTIDFDFRVGIVSMYRAQIVELRRHFEKRFGRDIVGKVDFNTVDGFQGQEKDVIILSCVRAGPGLQSVGFLSDSRRMNVALTRAKSSLFILGNAPTLERSDDTWRNIVIDARTRSCLTDTDTSYFTAPAAPPRLTSTKKPPRDLSSQILPSQALPKDLATPRDIKVAINRGPSSTSPTSVKSLVESQPNQRLESCDSSTRSTVDERTSLKRRADDDEPPQRPPPASRPPPGNSNSRARVPSMKRPKQPTLFIPKSNKSNKRP